MPVQLHNFSMNLVSFWFWFLHDVSINPLLHDVSICENTLSDAQSVDFSNREKYN